jgi:hypothetical protein
MSQILLLTGMVGVLLWTLAGAMCGCGSNAGPPLSRQDEEPAVSADFRVKETLPHARPGGAGPQEQLRRGPEPDYLIPVFPPGEDGTPGMTLAEVKARAAAARPVDPDLVPAFPPDQDGAPAMTVAEVKARAAFAVPMDSQLIPAFPPD